MTEKPRGEIVNPHVVKATPEPMPDFKAMRKALEEKGWLKKHLDQAEQKIASWPEWMRVDIETQYRELRKQMEASHADH